MRTIILSMIFKFLLRFFYAKDKNREYDTIWMLINEDEAWWIENMIKISHIKY
jgi:hypothetical protein